MSLPHWLKIGIAYYTLAAAIFIVAFAYPTRDVDFTSPAILFSIMLLIPIYFWTRARNKTGSPESTPSNANVRTLFMISALFVLALSVRIPSVLIFGEPYEKTPVILLLVATILLIEKTSLINFGFKTSTMIRSLLFGVVFFIVFGLVGSFLSYGLIYAFTKQMPIQSFDASMALFTFPFMTFCVGISEEGLFRGYIQTKLAKSHSVPTAIISQAALFGGWHFVWNLHPFDPVAMAQYVGVTFFFGILFGYFYEKTRNLAPLILTHGLWNSVLPAIIQNQSVIDYFAMFSPASQLLALVMPYVLAYLLAFAFVKYVPKRL